MQASVIKNENGIVSVKIRRSGIMKLGKINHELIMGDIIEVKRRVNDPFLTFIRMIKPAKN